VRKRYRILLVVLLVAVVGGLAWQVLRPREPVYKGKSLSYWLGKACVFLDGEWDGEAEDAVRQIGTNAIPTLLQMLRAKDSALTGKLLDLAEKQPFLTIRHTSAYQRNAQAARAFLILEASAKEAVPALIEIYDQNISEMSQLNTASALGSIGPAAKSAVPSLLRGMNSPDEDVRSLSIQALGEIHAEPALVVPVLVKSLQDTKSGIKCDAAEALGEFGAEAKVVAPVLLQLLTDPDSSVRDAATNALKVIDPEAAIKAGVN
jgi:hypothetical protein